MTQTPPPLAAIIDIGSNSIRLVVYDYPRRAPTVLFNEKVMAGLGLGVAETGMLAEAAMARAIHALTRFAALVQQMGAIEIRVVATAAVREARNADDFLARIRALGLPVEVLSGEEEATAAGYGVLSAIPNANGIVGDLGGGSLELIRVCNGTVSERLSLPIGVLKVKSAAMIASNVTARLSTMMYEGGWETIPAGLPLYLVGGSWRTLARLHMRLTSYALPVLHQYNMASSEADALLQTLRAITPAKAKLMAGLPAARVPLLEGSAIILTAIAHILESSALIVSAYGLREGLLYEWLSPAERREHPLIAAARAEGQRESRFAEHGDRLNQWLAPLFETDNAENETLRHAACLLSDVSWRANPDFRAEHGLEIALHGSWVGIDVRGRAMLAQALFTGFGGGQHIPDSLKTLASDDDFAHAIRWGLAIRLAQRWSGGLVMALDASAVRLTPKAVELHVQPRIQGLVGEVIERRLKQLGNAFSRASTIVYSIGA